MGSEMCIRDRFDILGRGHDMDGTTTFAAIMTKNGHDQQQAMPVCFHYLLVGCIGGTTMSVVFLVVAFVAFVCVFLVVSEAVGITATQQPTR